MARRSTPMFASLALGLCVLVAGCDKQPAEAAKNEGKPAPEEKVEGDKDDKVDADAVALADADGDGEGCLHGKEAHDEGSCEHEAGLATGTGHFGDPFTIEEAKPLAEIIASAGDESVLVSGEVTSVCQAKGCWMVIKDGEAQARILMKDHKFAVPMDGKGKKAMVEGTIVEKTLSEAQVKHIEEDAGRDPEAVSGERKEYVLTATGVSLEAQA